MTTSTRRWQRPLGVVLLAAGAVVLGYVGWQLWGTNVVAHRHRDQVLAQLHRAWDEGRPDVVTGRGRSREVIRIPRFGRRYAVPVLEGTSDTVLATGFGHYAGTAGPGQPGNFAVAAHRITHGQPLRSMPELRKGDLVYVDTARTTYTYRLTTDGDDLVVPFTASWVLGAVPTDPDGDGRPAAGPGRLLTLTTCSELFHTDGRLVAFGELVATTPRA